MRRLKKARPDLTPEQAKLKRPLRDCTSFYDVIIKDVYTIISFVLIMGNPFIGCAESFEVKQEEHPDGMYRS